MNAGKLVFSQLMEHLPLHTFHQCVAKYPSRYPTLKFSHLDQFLCMAFAQLTYRESLCGNIPTFIHLSGGKMHEVNVLDILIPEAGSFYIMDRGLTDFARWSALHQAQAFFVTRAKSNLLSRRVYSRAVDKSTGLRCDQTIALITSKARKDYPQHLRRIKFYDAEHDKELAFLTNHFDLPALTIAQLYRCR